MRVLHVTHNDRWFPFHFEFMCKQLGLEGETFYKSEANFNAAKANAIWAAHSEYFNSFDAVFVSHVATWSRVFLQNDWKKPIYVWLFFRFDHDIDDQEIYYELIKEAKSRPNVKFIAATEQDRLYTQSVLRNFPVEVVSPFACVNNDAKTKILCDEDTFFLPGRHNETLVADKLDALGIPTYKQKWETSTPDLRGIRGIIHMPYVYATASLYENLALENIYFLPSEDFLRTLINEHRGGSGYFWDSHGEPTRDFKSTEWYREENKPLFVYYSSFKELKEISDSPNLKFWLADKKRNLHMINQQRFEETHRKWMEVFGDRI